MTKFGRDYYRAAFFVDMMEVFIMDAPWSWRTPLWPVIYFVS